MQQTPHEPITIRMSSKGQMVIPRAAREVHGVGEGTSMELLIEADGYRIVPQRNDVSAFLAFARTMAKQRGKANDKEKPSARTQFLQDYATALDNKTRRKRGKQST